MMFSNKTCIEFKTEEKQWTEMLLNVFYIYIIAERADASYLKPSENGSSLNPNDDARLTTA